MGEGVGVAVGVGRRRAVELAVVSQQTCRRVCADRTAGGLVAELIEEGPIPIGAGAGQPENGAAPVQISTRTVAVAIGRSAIFRRPVEGAIRAEDLEDLVGARMGMPYLCEEASQECHAPFGLVASSGTTT